MPQYFNTAGTRVDASVALDTNGRLRGGYSEVVGDGERVNFDITLRDAAAGSAATSTYLTDARPTHAIVDEVARQKVAHDERFAFLGDKAPAFDMQRAMFLATTNQRNAQGARVAAAMRDARHSGLPVPTVNRTDAPVAIDGAALVNLARNSRYL